jgi:NTE family protein
MLKIGLALGAGGARGLAHICFLEVFDELGIKPNVIAGSSIGAIIGAAYAAGVSASEIRENVEEIIFTKDAKFWELRKRSEILKAMNFIDPQLSTGGFIKGEKFVNFMGERLGVKTFEELKIPLKIIATDFIDNKAEILEKGDLLTAIRASYAIPGLFAPVEYKGKMLMDAGMSNPLPYDVISDECDITVAVDVTVNKAKQFKEIPPVYELLFASFSLMQRSIILEKLKRHTPDIYIDTNINNVRVHEFKKIRDIFEQARPLKSKLKRELEKFIARNQ